MATEAELAAVRPRLLGQIDEARIRVVDITRPADGVIADLLALDDLSPTISDALDKLGVGGAVAGTTLTSRVPGTRICGPTTTLRYASEGGNVGALMGGGQRAGLADRDLYAVSAPGDVAVFACGGSAHASVLGGLSARWAKRRGLAGVVIDGAMRDLDDVRANGVPTWSRAVTPVSGKHRMRAVEINGTVSLGDLTVAPGDVVAADETGVCVIPAASVVAVRTLCLAARDAERAAAAAIDRGASPDELAAILSPDRW